MKVMVARKKSTAEKVAPTTFSRTMAVRAEIVKPIGMPWAEFGDMLRDRRSVMHRLINAGTFSLAYRADYGEPGSAVALIKQEIVRRKDVANVTADELEKLSKKVAATLPKDLKDAFQQGTALGAIRAELESYQAWCSEEALKSPEGVERTRLERRAKMTLSSKITDALSQQAFDMLGKYRKNHGTRLPTMKKGCPIFVRDGGWELKKDDLGFCLGVNLEGATKERPRPGLVQMALAPSSGKHRGRLAAIAAGKVKAGTCKLVYDEGARGKNGMKGKWYAILTFTEVREVAAVARPTGDGVFVVHRGMHSFLYGVASDGRVRKIEGHKFRVTRERLTTRMRQARRVTKGERGTGAVGHGTSRRYQSHDQLDGKLKNVVKTFCQTAAAWTIAQARALGCAKIAIEDYGGQERSEDRAERRFLDHFPYYQLKESIAWACRREGFELIEYDASYVSTTCPACGTRDAAQHNFRTGIFHCSNAACGVKRDADLVAVVNGCRVSGIAMPGLEARWEEIRKIERAVEDQAARVMV